MAINKKLNHIFILKKNRIVTIFLFGIIGFLIVGWPLSVRDAWHFKQNVVMYFPLILLLGFLIYYLSESRKALYAHLGGVFYFLIAFIRAFVSAVFKKEISEPRFLYEFFYESGMNLFIIFTLISAGAFIAWSLEKHKKTDKKNSVQVGKKKKMDFLKENFFYTGAATIVIFLLSCLTFKIKIFFLFVILNSYLIFLDPEILGDLVFFIPAYFIYYFLFILFLRISIGGIRKGKIVARILYILLALVVISIHLFGIFLGFIALAFGGD